MGVVFMINICKDESNSNIYINKFLFISFVMFILSLNFVYAATLPTVGGDENNWGTILNNYLLVSHTENGTLKEGITIGTGLGDIGNGLPALEVAGQAVFTRDGATSFRLRGKDFSGNNVESYAGVFYNNAYDQTGGTGAKKTRVVYGSNENMDLEIQGSNHVRLTAVDNNVGTGRIRLAAEDEVQVHAGVTAAETDNLVATFTGNGLDINGEIRAINNGATSFRLRGVCDDTSYSGDDGVFGSTCQSYTGIFNNAAYANTGGTGARTTRAIYGSNEGMDLELQGSNHIRITAVDDLGGTGRIRLAAEDEIQFHVFGDGTGNAETDATKYIKFDVDGSSNPTIETNSGDLVLNPAGDVNLKNGFNGECDLSTATTLTIVKGVITDCS